MSLSVIKQATQISFYSIILCFMISNNVYSQANFSTVECDPELENCDEVPPDECDPEIENCDEVPPDECDPEIENCDEVPPDECDPEIENCDEPPVPDQFLSCYEINKVMLYFRKHDSKDKIKIQKAGFRLPQDAQIDLAQDVVTVKVDNMSYQIPAGSFQQKGDKPDYVYATAPNVTPVIKARLRFDKAEWEFDVFKDKLNAVDTSDGLEISLNIGGFQSPQVIVPDQKPNNLKKFEYKQFPRGSCRLDQDDDDKPDTKGNKLSCLAAMTVRHSSGRVFTKSTVEANLLHPETVFTDSVSGDSAAFHTSCSRPLSCGDISGNFTIVDISATPGDRLALKMGVADASCTLP